MKIVKHLPWAVPAIIPAIAAIYIAILQHNAPALRYELSKTIRLPLSTEQTLSFQEIDLVNYGNAPSETVSVKILRPGGTITVSRNSEIDQTQTLDRDFGHEITYASLPPHGRASIFFIGGPQLTEGDLQIHDKTDLAKSGLVGTRDLGSILYYIFVIVMVSSYGYFLFREIRASMLLYDAKYEPEKIIFLRKPFIISESKWKKILAEAVEFLQRPTFSGDLSSLKATKTYRYLSGEDFSELDGGRGKELLPAIESGFIALLKKTYERVAISRDQTAAGYYLKMQRPTRIDEKVWADVQLYFSTYFINEVIRRASVWGVNSLKETINALSIDGFTGPARHEALGVVENIYFYDALGELSASNPVEKIEKLDASILSDSRLAWLRRMAYTIQYHNLSPITSTAAAELFLRKEKPNFLTDEDYKDLCDQANTLLDLQRTKARYSALISAINSISKDYGVGEKPVTVEQDEWNNLLELQEKIAELKASYDSKFKQLCDDLDALEHEKMASGDLKQKVQRQLDVINRFLSDPSVLDRLESYDDTFAIGNLENLKKIATLLRSTE